MNNEVEIIKVGTDDNPHREYMETLSCVSTIEEAKEAAREAGYFVIDEDEGSGLCEETDKGDGTFVWTVTVIDPK